jgi:hypothetical protein
MYCRRGLEHPARNCQQLEQCLQDDGLLRKTTIYKHPYSLGTQEGREFKELGEMAFLERKSALFWQSVRANPLDYAGRVFDRFVGATLWYVPYNDTEPVAGRRWVVW